MRAISSRSTGSDRAPSPSPSRGPCERDSCLRRSLCRSPQGAVSGGRARSGIASAISAHAYVGLLGVSVEALEHAEPRTIFADHRTRFIGQHFLIGAGLQELADP